jgi:hypothetical protein
VDASLIGSSQATGGPASTTLTLRSTNPRPRNRVDYREKTGIDALTARTVSITSEASLPAGEEVMFVSILRGHGDAATGQVDDLVVSDEPSWMSRHFGDIAVLHLRGEQRVRSVRSAVDGSQPPASGAAWLLRLTPADPVVPWRILEGDPRCRPMPMSGSFVVPPLQQTEDCFDTETLAGMILAQTALAIAEAIDDGPMPARVVASEHRLYALPYLPLGAMADVPGFALLYGTNLTITTPEETGQATLLVPIGVHFGQPDPADAAVAAAIGTSLGALIDPLGPEPAAVPWAGRARTTLRWTAAPLPEAISRQIIATIGQRLTRFRPPIINVDGLDVSAFAALAKSVEEVAFASGSVPSWPPGTAVVAVPTHRATVEAAALQPVMTLAAVSTGIHTGKWYAGQGPYALGMRRVYAGTEGSVTVVTDLDAAGRVRRTTTLTSLQPILPIELRIVK